MRALVRRNAFAFACGVLLAACAGTEPVRNIENRPIGSSVDLTLEQVTAAIVRAGGQRGWVVDAVEPGHAVATLDIRAHTAMADIYYDTEAFSIRYRDSENLDYANGNIHRNYNKWVDYLARDIRFAVPW